MSQLSSDLLIVDSDEIGCCACVRQIAKSEPDMFTHEDEVSTLAFDTDSLADIEDYEESLWDDHTGEDQSIDPALCMPRASDLEPELTSQELAALDVHADSVQISRLMAMEVLLPEQAAEAMYPGQTPVRLTTKMVRSWRPKSLNGCEVWCTS